jgi:hypothetical protein
LDPVTFPRPDRSDYAPNFTKSADNPAVDVGWAEGTLSDGRPYRTECWAQDGNTYLSFFFSRLGYETATAEAVAVLLEGEGLLQFLNANPPLTLEPFRDASGNDLWMATVVIATEGGSLAKDSLDLKPYR